MNPITLTDDELLAITGRYTAASQARILKLMGIPFVPHPVDARLIVSRAAAEAALGGPVPAPATDYDVNIEGLRGTQTPAR